MRKRKDVHGISVTTNRANKPTKDPILSPFLPFPSHTLPPTLSITHTLALSLILMLPLLPL